MEKNKENFYAIDEEKVFEIMGTSKEGLTEEEVTIRLDKYGTNSLPGKKPPSIFEVMLHQIKNPLIFILIAAGIASIIIGEGTDAIFIFVVIIFNSALGTYQEYNAEKSAASLQNLLKIKANVLRNGYESVIPSEGIVPGDIVLLESGHKVPADLRLFEEHNLTADESFLTGESIASSKDTKTLDENTLVSDRKNMAFAGSTISTGRAKGIVVATGFDTEVGKIAEHVIESEGAKPPLVMRMERFTKQISLIIIGISIFLAIILRIQGLDYPSIFFFIVALAVSSIPEGLPVALTVALSIAVSRMSKRNVIVRRLPTVESLGSCTVIASDKTGTLTVNQQTAKLIALPGDEIFQISGQGYNGDGEVTTENGNLDDLLHICKISSLANEGHLRYKNETWEQFGDAIDVAFLAMVYKLGYEPKIFTKDTEILDIIPYESDNKFSAAYYKENSEILIGVKGAMEIILSTCKFMHVNGKNIPIDNELIIQQGERMAEEGYRVLAVAGGEINDFTKKEIYTIDDIPSLVFYGLVGFIDPLRKEATASVNKCKEAGIKVIMITGDHPITAKAISKDLGILYEGEPIITGQMLTEAGDPEGEEFHKLVNSSHVFARVSPIQKVEIVGALIDQGEFVAVTGDGVNDAPALKRANIGVAMGSGTDVAKEISSMIVTDDNFASIVSGVEEGRFAFDNVRKVIYLLISTGAAEIFLFMVSIFAGLPLPLLAVQLLWLNLVTNGIQDVALAFEGGEPGAMKRKPRRPDEKIFNNQMITQTLISGITIGAIASGFWYFLIEVQMMEEYHARNVILLLMVIMQNIHAFNCRSEYTSVFKIPLSRNYLLIVGVILAQGLHILSMHVPFMQQILRAEPVTLFEWFEVLVLAIPLLIIMEIYKYFNKKRSLK